MHFDEPFLPAWLREPLHACAITLTEAAGLFEHYLQRLRGHPAPLPRHLARAAERLSFWQLEADPTLH